MSIFVRFWGTRGSIPTPGLSTMKYGGNTSCIEIRINDILFICDGGTGVRELGQHLVQLSRGPIMAHMFFSHTHWDHIQGFPFFTPAYENQNQLFVYEFIPGEKRLEHLLHGQMQTDYFPVSFSDLGAQISFGELAPGDTVIEGVRVRRLEQNHPGRSFAYSFENNGHKIVYATDNELDLMLDNREQSLTDLNVFRRCPAAFVKFVENADLLIVDGQYTDEEYAERVGWGHARSNTAVDLASQAGVKQCAVFHHDPMQSDEAVQHKVNEGSERAKRYAHTPVVFGAREGLELKIG